MASYTLTLSNGERVNLSIKDHRAEKVLDKMISAPWIETGDGSLINTAHVVHIRPV